MFSVFIIAKESKAAKGLHSRLAQKGFACSIASDGEDLARQVVEQAPDLALSDAVGNSCS